MSSRRAPTGTLTDDERARVRALVDSSGVREAARVLGLQAEATVWKALAGAEIHTLTLSTVRAALGARAT